MSEESSCTPSWYWIPFCILSMVDVGLAYYFYLGWLKIREEKDDKQEEELKKNKERKTPTSCQTTGTEEQP